MGKKNWKNWIIRKKKRISTGRSFGPHVWGRRHVGPLYTPSVGLKLRDDFDFSVRLEKKNLERANLWSLTIYMNISWSEKKLCIPRTSLDAPTSTQILLNLCWFASWFTVWSCGEKETNECLLSARRDKKCSSLLCKRRAVRRRDAKEGASPATRCLLISFLSLSASSPRWKASTARRADAPSHGHPLYRRLHVSALQLECRGVNKAGLLCIFKPI